jgi:nitrate/TMAO reductase-like tetraheme cytochrome c subunit
MLYVLKQTGLLFLSVAVFLLVLHGETILSPLNVPQITKKPFSFSCFECHDYLPANHQKREMVAEHLNVQLSHGDQWCYDCHQDGPFYELINADKERLSWRKGNEHCGSCHEDIFQDWRFGAHGRRTGFWREGEKYGMNCVECHNAHNPAFPPRQPLPPPLQLFRNKQSSQD